MKNFIKCCHQLSWYPYTLRSQTLDEEEVLEQLAGVEGGAPAIIESSVPQQGAEVVVRREKCDLIQFMDRIPGQLEITTHHLFFLSSERRDGHSCMSVAIVINVTMEILPHASRGDGEFQGEVGPAS